MSILAWWLGGLGHIGTTLIWKIPIQQQVSCSFPKQGTPTRKFEIPYGGYFICCLNVDKNAPIPDPDMRLVGRWRHGGSSRHSGIGHRDTCQLGFRMEMWKSGLSSPPCPVHENHYMLLFWVERLEDGYKDIY